MSDTDEFDKEAERERLREKYEADRADREATQRMSELLLQGATMTNRHCENCGDPVFRHDGREFCPSCGAGDASAAGADGPAPDDAGAPDTGHRGEDAGDDSVAGGTPPAAHPDEDPAPPAGRADDGSPPAEPDEPVDAASGGPAVAGAGADDPRTALATTAARMARRADAAEDPEQAREWLAAAREAAAALSALDSRTPDGG